MKNKLTELLDIKHPIIQAPMAGGITTANLVAAISESGGLGTLGAGYLNTSQMRKEIREIKQKTNHFGINLFVPNEFSVSTSDINRAIDILQPYYKEFNINAEDFEVPSPMTERQTFIEQVQVVIEEQVPVCSFTFGIPSTEVIKQLKQNNIVLVGTATTVKEAIDVEKSGMDSVTVQGIEAGGHRGSFINDSNEGLIGLMSLIPQVVDQVTIPVIAAGGIMDGRGLSAALCLGAEAVQMGTAFLTCIESGAHKVHKEVILTTSDDQTVLTRSFSGKWARGIKNKFIEDMVEKEEELPEFPVQNSLTKKIRSVASIQSNRELMSLWSGQSPMLARNTNVKEIINEVMAETEKILGDLK
ncbi:NAD(P)H-dependent flavin oxidoreductase [Salipaludibacillus neizhouensis]|uniref:NAD(P)H-dependent flavin oxidoreductase n=1 Tax=Salipaludibacillus neizhouensis TaxID=885475 RepID=UPI000DA60F8E|nr:nitronate monooxygenase [Salipaludibacillus neizhouensis]